MPDYKNGKIYKMWSPQGDEIYIGSTTQPLYARLHQHKIKSVCSSKILFEKYNDVRIELIELYSCDNKEQLTKKEGEYIRKLDCVNRCIAGRTKKESSKEWRDDNKEYCKEYRENNKEHRCEKFNCECGGKYLFQNKSHHLKTKKHTKFMNSQQEQQPRE